MSDCLSPVIGSAHLCPFASDSDFQALILESSNDGQETEADWKNQIVLPTSKSESGILASQGSQVQLAK